MVITSESLRSSSKSGTSAAAAAAAFSMADRIRRLETEGFKVFPKSFLI